jgi:hypothetical protein
VAANVRSEAQFREDNKFHDFLGDLATREGITAESVFTAAVKGYRLEGRDVTCEIPCHTLYRLVQASHYISDSGSADNKELDARARFEDEILPLFLDPANSEWRVIVGPWMLRRNRNLDEELRGPVFACAAREAGIPPHVAEDGDMGQLSAALGMGWLHYPVGWWFLFVYAAGSVDRLRIPTVADAGWSAWFRPAPDGAEIGHTVDLSGGKGYPEVAHANRDCSNLIGPPLSFFDNRQENTWETACE